MHRTIAAQQPAAAVYLSCANISVVERLMGLSRCATDPAKLLGMQQTGGLEGYLVVTTSVKTPLVGARDFEENGVVSFMYQCVHMSGTTR
jgi:hypothetical protein